MSKSKQSIVCFVILLAMPLMALAQRGGKGAAPTVSSISPATATAGGAGFALTVAGSSFTLGSVVQWNGANLTTTYVSASQLQVSISSALISVAGTAQINVFTAGRGGGTSNAVAFTINPAATTTTTTTGTPLAITTTSLPAGTAGTAYSQTLAASGGTAPYTWSTTSGTVPPGLSLSSAGAISGTPTTNASYSFTAQVADSASHTATQAYSMVISTAPLAIATTSVPAGTAGTAYSTALAASGGAPPHNWSTTSGALPPGLALSAAGGISGNPATAGSYAFTAQVADSASHTAAYTYTLTVGASTTTTTTGPVFWSGFEPSDTPWNGGMVTESGCITNGLIEVTSASPALRTGVNGGHIHYVIGASECYANQDQNREFVQIFNSTNGYPNGLEHFFIRGYFMGHLNAGGTDRGTVLDTLQRKLIYLKDYASQAMGLNMGLTSDGRTFRIWTGKGSTYGCNAQGSSFSAGWCPGPYCMNPPQWQWDTWYELELEVNMGSPGMNNGAIGFWVNGTKYLDVTNYNLRGTCTQGFQRFEFGVQANRSNFDAVDEERYWDDVVISTAGPIGP